MQKIKVCEIFGPSGYWEYTKNDNGELNPNYHERWGVTQGEGNVGQVSTFIRTFGCGFRCAGFGLPVGQLTTEPLEIAKNINIYKSIAELPAAQYGCDSYFSIYPEFKSLAPVLTTEVIAAQILQASAGSFFKHPTNTCHLIFTGGEPMLGWQRAYVELIRELRRQDPIWAANPTFRLPVTFETNGTEPVLINKVTGVSFISEMTEYCDITWSISAKLTASGHAHDEAIKPQIVKSYLDISNVGYFKFVVTTPAEFEEVDAVVKTFNDAGINIKTYIMPEGGTLNEYKKHSTVELVSEAVKRGYNITPRLQVLIGDNSQSW